MINPLGSRAMQNHPRTPYGVLPGSEEVKVAGPQYYDDFFGRVHPFKNLVIHHKSKKKQLLKWFYINPKELPTHLLVFMVYNANGTF